MNPLILAILFSGCDAAPKEVPKGAIKELVTNVVCTENFEGLPVCSAITNEGYKYIWFPQEVRK